MTKNINTLVEDIYGVVKGNGGWDNTFNEYFKEKVGATMQSRLSPKTGGTFKPRLRFSNMGTECRRKLWYDLNSSGTGKELEDHMSLLFLYGDLLEELVLVLAEAAGHTVTGQQDTCAVLGVRGRRDAVIDGVIVDAKSTSARNFKKFVDGSLFMDDPYGYIRQLEGYVYDAKTDPLVTDKTGGAFLVIDKSTGKLTLDYHDFSSSLGSFEDFITETKAMVADSTPPDRGYVEMPDGKSGNMKVDVHCGWCPHVKTCWPGIRAFQPRGAPMAKYLSTIKREPKMEEIEL